MHDCDADGVPVDEKVHAREDYHGRDRYDYALFEDGSRERVYGQVLAFFQVLYKGDPLSLCLTRRFFPANTSPHITGMTVVEPGIKRSYKGLSIARIEDIDQVLHIVPDFSSDKLDETFYHRYLINHDADRHTWAAATAYLPALDNRISWDDIQVQNLVDITAEEVHDSE